MLKQMRGRLLLILLGCWLAAGWAVAAQTIDGVRLETQPDRVQLILDLSARSRYTVATLDRPDRLVVDVRDAQLRYDLGKLPLQDTPVKRARSGVRNGSDARLVVELDGAYRVQSAMQAADGGRHRLVVDLYPRAAAKGGPVAEKSTPEKSLSAKTAEKTASGKGPARKADAGSSHTAALNRAQPGSTAAADPAPTATADAQPAAADAVATATTTTTTTTRTTRTTTARADSAAEPAERRAAKPVKSTSDGARRDIIIAIDAGHGGDDPGAIGPGQLQEKRIALAIAKELAALFERERGYKPVLTRNGDYFLPLKTRRDLARKAQADLFISVHADAFSDRDAQGGSVFALSDRGATSTMAAFLAASENNADAIGGVSTEGKDDDLVKVLADLSLTATMDSSLRVGRHVLNAMGGVTRLHAKRVEQAAFVVLKSPDTPSILVETGFVSNPQEARRLASRDHQQKIARAIFTGVDRHFNQNPPPNTYIAWQKRNGRAGADSTLASAEQ